ncbi:ladinin-1 [Erinaceus europaeus]|uniref:Ladinin-1 n=1 Tax=Erinaceus europaeus TaxID=9365 RepID=A0A1S3WA26_ERIEU|nr:ladinin-1 [Erinaceus europaeus]
MSGRKDWSALSSLARQRTLEDEEEQERERRRRNRNLSSTSDEGSPRLTPNGDQKAAERLPSVDEAEVPRPPPPTPRAEDQEEDVQAILRSRKERRQRRQAVEGMQTQASVPERPQPEEGRGGPGPTQAKQEPLTSKREKETEAPLHRRLSREQRGPWAKEGESLAGGQPKNEKKEVVSEKVPAPGKPPSSEKAPIPEKKAPEKRLVSEETSTSRKAPERTSVSEMIVLSEKRTTLEKKFVLEKTGGSEKTLPLGKTGGSERRLVSEKAQLFEKSLVSEKTPAPETKPVPKPQVQAQLAPKEQGGQASPEKKPSSPAERPPSRFPPITLQVKIPSREEKADVVSPTYSSSLKRSSPRTISFRMSPKKENIETTLTRSASVRLPPSASKLGEKLEKYHAAVQRSGSLKAPSTSRTEFFVAPSSVATRRHVFEKEQASQGRAEPASSLKENWKLSGVVTSKLNLWISRTQDSGEQDPQEVQEESATSKRAQWAKKAGSTLDAEV